MVSGFVVSLLFRFIRRCYWYRDLVVQKHYEKRFDVKFDFYQQGPGELVLIGEMGDLSFGNGVTLKSDTFIDCKGGLSIGSNFHTGSGLRIFTRRHVYKDVPDLPYDRTPQSASVTIGDDVWLGERVTVLPGVTIGHRAIVGAGAIVYRDVEADEIVASAAFAVIGTRC